LQSSALVAHSKYPSAGSAGRYDLNGSQNAPDVSTVSILALNIAACGGTFL
jgi:hypothetical protein